MAWLAQQQSCGNTACLLSEPRSTWRGGVRSNFHEIFSSAASLSPESQGPPCGLDLHLMEAPPGPNMGEECQPLLNEPQ